MWQQLVQLTMKKLLCLLLAFTMTLVLFGCSGSPASPGSEDTTPSTTGLQVPENAVALKVMTYNMLGKTSSSASVTGDGSSATENLTADLSIANRGPMVNAMLNGEGIDIAGLQEVSNPWQDWLENGLDSKYSYFGQVTQSTSEGCCVIYRADKLQLLAKGAFWLAPGAPTSSELGWDATYDRLCVWGILQVIETGEYIAVMNTHLDHKGMQARIEGAKLILEQMELLRQKVEKTYGVKDCPVILTGDMNSNAEHTVCANYTEKLNDSFSSAAVNPVDPKASTSPGLHYVSTVDHVVKDSHRIDFVYTSLQNVLTAEYKMIQTSTNLCEYGAYMSDHNAVIVLLYITN